MSSRSAVCFVAFVLVLCHPLPVAAQVSRPVGSDIIEYRPGAEADVERVAQAITRANDYVAQKYGYQRHPLARTVIHLNVGGTRPGVRASCCLAWSTPFQWEDIVHSGAWTRIEAYISVVGPLDNNTERQLTARFIAFALGFNADEHESAHWWFRKGLPALEDRYARGASAAEVHTELAQWVSAHHDEVSRAFRRHGETDYFFFTDAATGGAAWLQYLAEQLGEGVHARLLWDNGPYEPTRALRRETGDTLESLWRGFLEWK